MLIADALLGGEMRAAATVWALLFAQVLGCVTMGCGRSADCPTPEYGGTANEAMYHGFVEGERGAVLDLQKGGEIIEPQEGQQYAGSGLPPTFSWRSSLMIMGGQVAHLLSIGSQRSCPLEVLTTETSWTPSDAAWVEITQATGEERTLEILSAHFLGAHVSDGPYRSPVRTFRIVK